MATYKVKKGDCLWNIAKAKLGNALLWTEIAKINNIKPPYTIYSNQELNLPDKSGSSSTATVDNSNKPKIEYFGFSGNDNELLITWTWDKDNTKHFRVTWYYYLNGVKYVGQNNTTTEPQAQEDPNDFKYSTYKIPDNDNATKVEVKVLPISKEKDGKNNTKTTYWTADWSDIKSFDTSGLPPLAPGTPTPTLDPVDKLKLNVSLDRIDKGALHCDVIDFQVLILKDGKLSAGAHCESSISEGGHAEASFRLQPGGDYRVRARSKKTETNTYSEYSDYSDSIVTMPASPGSITALYSKRKGAKYYAHLEWNAISIATSYTIQYTEDVTLFDTSNGVQSITVNPSVDGFAPPNSYDIEISVGDEDKDQNTFYFRVQAANDSGSSAWSEIKSIKIGEAPDAPTTWSSSTSAVIGEDDAVTLYWIHNSVDGSAETYAQLELIVNGTTQLPIDIKNNKYEYKHVLVNYSSDGKYTATDNSIDTGNCTVEIVNGAHTTTGEQVYKYTDSYGGTGYFCENVSMEDDPAATSEYTINPNDYGLGAVIRWCVKTAGVTLEYGEWSVQREISIYPPPSITLRVSDPQTTDTMNYLQSYPLHVEALVEAATQTPISYYISIVANEDYETVDNVGNVKMVKAGEEVFSRIYDIADLDVYLGASDMTLAGNAKYTISCTVTMNTGLTATESCPFTTGFTAIAYTPNAEISLDPDRVATYIHPYASKMTGVRHYNTYKVEKKGRNFVKTKTEFDPSQYDPTQYNLSIQSGKRTTTGEQVYSYTNYAGDSGYYCTEISFEGTETLVEGVTLSVYRREYDGGFTEIATGLENRDGVYVVDPHPSLDYARYRIIATATESGDMCYYDVPGYPIGEKSIIIQWDEAWSSFDAEGTDTLDQQPLVGSMIKLLYNIDISDTRSTEVTMIQYAGRNHPVSYYGTHRGETATWNAEILKTDKDTLYALRRLSIWNGDVYVREPSGLGYWANIKVTYPQTHCELTIPVSMNITRVEGGI